MNLQEIYDQLTFGELSQVKMGNAPEGQITPENKRRVIGHIELGLTALYKRFRLKENELLVLLHPKQHIYKLKYEHLSDLTEDDLLKYKEPQAEDCALNTRPEDRLRYEGNDRSGDVSDTGSGIAFIDSTKTITAEESSDRRSLDDEPPKKYLIETGCFGFEDDLLKIERIYNDQGDEILLNKRDDPHSIRTPNKDTIVLPKIPHYDHHQFEYLYHHGHHRTDNTRYARSKTTRGFAYNYEDNHKGIRNTCLRVAYRAKHPKIDLEAALDCRSEDYDIELPDSHLQALLYYIGSRVMNPIGMQNEFHAGNSYFAKYEAECQRLEKDNYQIDNDGSVTTFEEGGFV